ncbi:uncharacterized protein MELLADRAFT_66090 [Melampsora larici-populina 98AG31]|uniref:Uncharacterized protein n=1 Tax=Melampsora larici-populina (strain 98AG31 / pathotype 3-4-7) TaxID=747676 RepID=F4RXU5_MELLP|nr:uncharacterized protein MELLADRAFT_66090 [Melampsora larici-populina 98AG31]EGG02791.1 hypothetical protein MELLADRAFT_66090 [Melampsora larici-populina 98AG31]
MVYREPETKTYDRTGDSVSQATKDAEEDIVNDNNTEKTTDVNSTTVQKAENVNAKGVRNTNDDSDDGTNDFEIGYRKPMVNLTRTLTEVRRQLIRQGEAALGLEKTTLKFGTDSKVSYWSKNKSKEDGNQENTKPESDESRLKITKKE